jgi:hypothetical protein
MGSLDRPVAGWLLVVLAAFVLTSMAAARAASHKSGRGARWPDRVTLAIGVLVLLFIADAGGLALLGYLPMILGAIVVGSPPDLDPSNVWSSLVSLFHTTGGLALVLTGIVLRRVARQACAACGRAHDTEDRRRPQGLQRWARHTVTLAVVVPLFYAVTRIAWFVGIPLGVDSGMPEDMGDARWAGLGLAAGAIVGAILTTGLVSRWGETFPRWVPGLRGRPVPVGLAVVPALFVAATVTSAGVSFILTLVSPQFGQLPGTTADWGAWLPTTLWPLWGAALFASAMAYRTRRLPPCPFCGGIDDAVASDRRGATDR